MIAVLVGICGLADAHAQRDDRIRFNDQDLWLNGSNVAWINFARDIGPGATRLDLFEEMFRELRDHGGNTFRLWLHTNGANTPEFAGTGLDAVVVGPGAGAIDDLRDILDLAHTYDISLMLCLWSFDMLGIAYGTAITDRNMAILNNEDRLQAYIDNALTPMVEALKGHPAILAWEIFNEPEGMSTELGWSHVRRVPMSAIQRFVNRTVGAIKRTDPDVHVTNGSWAFRATSDAHPAKTGEPDRVAADLSMDELEELRRFLSYRYRHAFTLEEAGDFFDTLNANSHNFNYYRDDRLIAAGGDPDGVLDFYTVHYYDWAGTGGSPFHHDKAAWGLDKPLAVGEFYMRNTFGVQWRDLYQVLYDRGYAGALSWQWFDWWAQRDLSEDCVSNCSYNWPRTLEVTQQMFNDHREDVELIYPGMRMSLSVDLDRIEAGQSVTLTWWTRSAVSVLLDDEPVDEEGSRVVMLTETTTFRLEATDDDGATDFREVTVDVVDPDQINRARGMRAVASSNEGDNEEVTNPANDPNAVTDGDPNTRWSSSWRDNEWIYVDLGRVYDLASVVLLWEVAHARNYNLDVSYDARSWTTVEEVREKTSPAADTLRFDGGTTARFVRMHGLTRATQWGFSLWEFEAYGLIAEYQPPGVAITRPEPDDLIEAGTDLSITAEVTYEGAIDHVIFFVDGDSLGAASEAPFTYVWEEVPLGTYTLSAIAVDAEGYPGVSDPVEITITEPVERTRYDVAQALISGNVERQNDPTASGGTRLYMTGPPARITWNNVQVANTRAFELVIGYRLLDGHKNQYILVNGEQVADLLFDGLVDGGPGAQPWQAKSLGVTLQAGSNQIAIDHHWGWMYFDYIEIVGNGQAVSAEEDGLPATLALGANYPNPFNPSTVIPFSIAEAAHVRIDVFDVTGRRVATLVDGLRTPGEYTATFDAQSLAGGMYLYRLQAGDFVQVRRMMLVN